MVPSSPLQYDAMAGDVYGSYSYMSQHHGDDSPPTYTVYTPVGVVYSGEQAKAAFLLKHGYVHES